MKKVRYLGKAVFVILGVLLLFVGGIKGEELSLNVLTYNMRYENINEPDPVYSWKTRKPGIIYSLMEHDADIVGTQELRKWQLDDLMDDLGMQWDAIGEPSILSNEHCAIIFRSDRFEYLEGDTIWLSETPHVKGSKSWNSAHPRIVTYGKFRSKINGAEFYVFNTHLDHISAQARREGLKIIVEMMLELEEYPVIFTGDFNMSIDSRDMEPILVHGKSFSDTFSPFAPEFEGRTLTSHGFAGGTEGKAIDFIFYSKAHWDVISTEIIRDKWERRYFYSDHYPVCSKLQLK